MMLTRMLPARSLRACCQPSVAHFSSSVAARAAPEIQPMQLPPMSSVVPNSCLTFEEHTIFSAGRFSPRLNVEHLVGEYKVKLTVNTAPLDLSPEEQARLKVLVGSRFDAPKQKVVLTAEKFPNRVENKRYLIHILENLLRTAKGAASS